MKSIFLKTEKKTRDFVFIEDVVDATILGLETKEAAGHASISVQELALMFLQ